MKQDRPDLPDGKNGVQHLSVLAASAPIAGRVGMHTAVLVAAVVLVVLFFASFMIGQYPISPSGVLDILGSKLFGYESAEPAMVVSRMLV